MPRPWATSAAAAQPSSAALAAVAAEREAAQEAGREGVAAAGGVDDLDVERGHRLGAVDISTPSPPQRGDDAAGAAVEQRARALDDVGGAREAEHLLAVGQQVVRVLERGRDPVEQARLAGREHVGGGDGAVLARVRQHLRRGLAAHELGPAEVHVGRGGDRVESTSPAP